MSLVQILVIWGAASAALFSFPVYSGEWENFKELKAAMVRSAARRDIPLPPWASTLDYVRPYHFWDLQPKRISDEHSKPDEKPAPIRSVDPDRR